MSTTAEREWRALLVDDERLASKRLTALLAAHPEIRVVDQVRDLASARAAIAKRAPDVIFLDAQLPPENGFDLLPDVPATTAVIFVTAHDAFAVRAFETNALDYLLKPVLPARLAATIDRLTRSLAPAPVDERGPRLRPDDPLVLRDGRRWHKMNASEVAAICGEGSYTRLYRLTGESMLLPRSLTHWATILPEKAFVRIGRSILVNLHRVERLEAVNRNLANLHLTGHSAPLPLGRAAAQHFRRALRRSEAAPA